MFSIFFSIKTRCDNSVRLQNISKVKFYFILTLENPNLQRLICLKAQTYHLLIVLTYSYTARTADILIAGTCVE